MSELVRVADRAHGLDAAVGDVEREDEDRRVLGAEEDRARLPVDLDQPHASDVELLPPRGGAEEQAQDPVAAANAARNTATAAVTALLLGLVGSVIGGWMGSGEPMTFTHHRTRATRSGKGGW